MNQVRTLNPIYTVNYQMDLSFDNVMNFNENPFYHIILSDNILMFLI